LTYFSENSTPFSWLLRSQFSCDYDKFRIIELSEINRINPYDIYQIYYLQEITEFTQATKPFEPTPIRYLAKNY